MVKQGAGRRVVSPVTPSRINTCDPDAENRGRDGLIRLGACDENVKCNAWERRTNIMQNSAIFETPLRDLFRGLTGETKKFIKEEARLARAEISEKISRLGRNGVILAVGGCLAYAGLIVFLAGLGVLLAFVFEQAGLSPALAGFLGLAIIGLLFAILGGLLAFKAVKKLSRESLAPEKTVRTL